MTENEPKKVNYRRNYKGNPNQRVKAGVKGRPPKSRYAYHKPLKRCSIRDLIQLYIDSGYSTPKVGKLLGLTRQSIINRLRRAGFWEELMHIKRRRKQKEVLMNESDIMQFLKEYKKKNLLS